MREFAAAALVCGMSLFPAALQAANLPDPSPEDVQNIIQKFAAKEAAFAQARGNYTYRQSAKVIELDDGGSQEGKWEIVSDIIFTPDGKRSEKVVYSPVNTLSHLLLTPEDEQDLRDVQPFVLTTSEIPEYYIRYIGREQVDEIGTYVFAVKPKKMESGKRYFEGEIWVDDRDLQIVKTYGRGVGLQKRGSDNQFPKFATYREQIDGKYWFPTYTIANDTLHFKEGLDQRVKMVVKYEDYKQFKSDVNIKYGDEVNEPKDQPKGQTPPPTKK